MLNNSALCTCRPWLCQSGGSRFWHLVDEEVAEIRSSRARVSISHALGSVGVQCWTSCGSALLCVLLVVRVYLPQGILSHMALHSSSCGSSTLPWQLVLFSLSLSRSFKRVPQATGIAASGSFLTTSSLADCLAQFASEGADNGLETCGYVLRS